MPRRDGTGPMGMGSRTGRGMGNCPPSGTTGQMNANYSGGGGMWGARGAGRGAGRGMCRWLTGFRRWFSASELAAGTPVENEEKVLRDQAAVLKKQLDEIDSRLNNLKK